MFRWNIAIKLLGNIPPERKIHEIVLYRVIKSHDLHRRKIMTCKLTFCILFLADRKDAFLKILKIFSLKLSNINNC